MGTASFHQLLEHQWAQKKFLCVGLDSDLAKIPSASHCYKSGGSLDIAATLLHFNKAIIDATATIAAAYKPNPAFYEPHGLAGTMALEETIGYLHQEFPQIPIIFDAKRADIGNTNLGYLAAAFDHLGADAITLHPYLGKEALLPFLERKEKGIIILCRTSNSGSGEFQDLLLQNATPLYLHIAEQVASHWNEHGNCALVVGATYPEELTQIRQVVDEMPLLIPGIGTQGGDIAATVSRAKNKHGSGMILNISRAILFASAAEDFASAAYEQAHQFHQQVQSSLP